MKFTLKGLVPLFIFLALSIAFGFGLTKDPRKLPSQLIDRPFPEFLLPDLMDEENTLDNSYLQGQVTLVNIFGSWCVACDQEHPMLMKLSREGDIAILGVDWRDTREDGLRWLARGGNPYGRVVFDEHSKLAIDLGVTGAPESFLVDKKGQIRYKYIGPITQSVWDETLKPLAMRLEIEP
ncbi:MAG: DsbE family thiol:disulfide interchange protein [Robiginitomaculum sp.]|nr:DsbE family thiol:disulfide interchange protein [Robiginitomaculum sp.]